MQGHFGGGVGYAADSGYQHPEGWVQAWRPYAAAAANHGVGVNPSRVYASAANAFGPEQQAGLNWGYGNEVQYRK